MGLSEFGVLCLRSLGALLVVTQTRQGYCIHILEQDQQILEFSRFLQGRPENKFIHMSAEEAESCLSYLEELKKRSEH